VRGDRLSILHADELHRDLPRRKGNDDAFGPDWMSMKSASGIDVRDRLLFHVRNPITDRGDEDFWRFGRIIGNGEVQHGSEINVTAIAKVAHDCVDFSIGDISPEMHFSLPVDETYVRWLAWPVMRRSICPNALRVGEHAAMDDAAVGENLIPALCRRIGVETGEQKQGDADAPHSS
jgi:hypothetical protein